MSAPDDMDEQLQAYRQKRDKELPADRRLLPVHKDRLMAEVRRRYGEDSPGRGLLPFLRPALRWAVIAAPVLVLAFIGYFWVRNAPSRSDAHLSLAPATAPMAAPEAAGEGKLRAFTDKDEAVVGEKEGLELEQRQPTRALERDSYREFAAKQQAPASAAAASAPPAEIGDAVAGSVDQSRMSESKMSRNEAARSKSQEALAALDLSGNYRGRVLAAGFDARKAKSAKLAKDDTDVFSNFKLEQTADTVTLVAANGDRYTGKILNAGESQRMNQQRQLQNKNAQPPLQQAALVGTNALTNRRMSLLANFFAQEPKEETLLESGERVDALAGMADEKSPLQLRVVIEELDEQNQPREIVIDAERLGPIGGQP